MASQSAVPLSSKADILRAHCALAAKAPIAEVISKAAVQLGLAAELEGKSLIAKADRCLQALGVGDVSPVVVQGFEVDSQPVAAQPVAAVAVQPVAAVNVTPVAAVAVQPVAAVPAVLVLGAAPSHGNPASSSRLNTELNNVARNTNDTDKARALVAAGADLTSTNGGHWRHTPLHQAAYHGRFEMARTLLELDTSRRTLRMRSNPCGRGSTGIPLELARGGGHRRIVELLERAMGGEAPAELAAAAAVQPVAAVPAGGQVPRVRGGGNRDAADIAGCWGCLCMPGGAAIEMKQAHGPDVLHHKGIALTLLTPLGVTYEDKWTRVHGDVFQKENADDKLDYSGSGDCVCLGPGITCKVGPACFGREHRAIPAEELQGTWACGCVPCGWACYHKEAQGSDTLRHHGVLFLGGVLPIPFDDLWDRVQGKNTFHKRDDHNMKEVYFGSGWSCAGLLGCGAKLG